MDRDRQYNSRALQARFPKVYKEFFGNNNIVVSSDMYFNLTPGMSWRSGAPAVAQKINLRCYVGARREGEVGKITIGEQLVFYSQHEEFRTPDFQMLDWKTALPALEKIVRQRVGNDAFEGITLSIIVEMPENRAVDAGLSINLVSATYLALGWVTPALFEEIRSLTYKQIQAKDTPASRAYAEMFTDSLKVRLGTYYGVTSGFSSYASVLASEFPIVYATEERAGSVSKPELNLPVLDVLDNPDLVDDYRTWPFRLNELADDITGSFPFDVVSIYPGAHREYGSASVFTTRGVVPSFDDMRDSAKKMFAGLEFEEGRAPSFLKDLDVDGKYWQSFSRGQTISRLYLTLELANVYREKYKSSSRLQFLETLDSLRFINAPFEETPSRNIRQIMSTIVEKAQEVGAQIAIRNLCFGKQDGNILIFSSQQKFRDEIFEVVEALQEKNPKIHIDFASWRDGFGSEGFKTEQFISKGLYSQFIEKGSKQLTYWNGEGELQHRVTQDASPKDFEVYLDQVSGKIFIGGSPVTSKDVPSQKASIEILSSLLEEVGKSVPNHELPGQSYSNYRNELQGKIIGPVDKLIQERIGKSLGVTISGQLTQFEVRLDPKELSIAVVRDM